MRQTIENILKEKDFIINDGAAGTHLESFNCDLNHKLWTAKILKEQPNLIKQVHLDYFEAGADCGMSVSYQATIKGLMENGSSEEEACEIIKSSITILNEARDEWYEKSGKALGRPYPLISGAVGPYGAYLANGAEYRGDYEIDKEFLINFHKKRMTILWEAGADLLAIETIPNIQEAIILAEIAEEIGAKCWLTFSCKNYTDISDGTPIKDAVKMIEKFSSIVSVGVNCTAPKYISNLIDEIKKSSDKYITIYANSGEKYDPITKTWDGSKDGKRYVDYAVEWKEKGATLIGGCCGTTPKEIKEIKNTL